MPRPRKWPPTLRTEGNTAFVRYTDQTGQSRRITLGPAGSPEALQAYARLIAEGAAFGVVAPPAPPIFTVSELALAYEAHARKRYEDRHHGNITRALGGAVSLYGGTPAADFGPRALQTVMDSWVKEGLARSHVNRLARLLRAAFKWAAAAELVPSATWERLGVVPGLRRRQTDAPERPRVRPPDPALVEATLPHLPPIVADLCRLLRLTGMRPGEGCALRPCDIDRQWKTVDGVTLWLYRLGEEEGHSGHKGLWRGGMRWVPLVPAAQEVLAPYLDREPTAACFSPREVYLQWCREAGLTPRLDRKSRNVSEQYTTHALAKCVRQACDRAFPPIHVPGAVERKHRWLSRLTDEQRAELRAWRKAHRWHPNQLRHLVATEIATVLSKEDARAVLGHTNPSTTDVYVEQVERAARALAAMGRVG